MQFLLLIHLDERSFNAFSKDEQNRVHAECGAWHDDLVRSGHSRACLGLRPSKETLTVRDRLGQIVATDGPHAETKEVLGGFEHLECRDRAEARAIAERFPGLRAGCLIEIRPVIESGKCEAE